MPLYINSTDVNAITEAIDEASMSVISAYQNTVTIPHQDSESCPEQIAKSLDQFVDILLLIEVDKVNAVIFQDVPTQLEDSILRNESKPLDAMEISEIGNHGLSLLQSLSDWAFTLHLSEVQHKIHFVMVAVSLWVARHGGQLYQLDSIVNTVTALANATMDSDVLVELTEAIGELIYAVSDDVKHEASVSGRRLDKSWRALNISRGIIATRSHRVETIEQVFDQLVHNLPEDASIFFEEGLQQLDMLDYPMHVKDIMVKYFREHTTQVLH